MRGRWTLPGLALLIAGGCTEVEPKVSFAYDPSLAKVLVAKSAEWPAACKRPPSERIGVPAALYHQANQRPVPPDFVKDLGQVVKDLPRPLARLFERHVCAVVLIHDVPMTGTLMLLDQEPTRAIVLLDVEKLSLSPNEWFEFKESSVFEAAPNRRIVGKLAEPSQNTRSVLMEFVLVHELGHVVDAAFPEHILIEEFKRISWPRRDALAKTPLLHYPTRHDAAPLPAQTLEAYYDLIATGPFASPATVSREPEDFADSLATFVHTVIRGRPWELEVHQDGKLVRKLNACWAEPRCRAKREILELLLQRWSAG